MVVGQSWVQTEHLGGSRYWGGGTLGHHFHLPVSSLVSRCPESEPVVCGLLPMPPGGLLQVIISGSKELLLGYFRSVSRSLPTALSWVANGSESSWQQVAQRYCWASFKVAEVQVCCSIYLDS